MTARNTLFNGVQKNKVGTSIVRSTRTHKRLRFSGMGTSKGGSTEMIDARGWDSVRWHTGNPQYKYFGTETTVGNHSDWAGSTDTWYRMVKSGKTTERVQLKQKFTSGSGGSQRNFYVWKKPVFDMSVANWDNSEATITNGTSIWRNVWPSQFNGGHFAADTSGNETKITNSDIVVQPSNSTWASTFQDDLEETYKYGEWVIELLDPWDPSQWPEADTHEHTISHNGSSYYDGNALATEQLGSLSDYRPAVFAGGADGFSLVTKSGGYCKYPPPFLVFQMRNYPSLGRDNMNVRLDLFVDLYREAYSDNTAELSDMNRADSWQVDTHE